MAERKNIEKVAERRSWLDMGGTVIRDPEGKVVFDGKKELRKKAEERKDA